MLYPAYRADRHESENPGSDRILGFPFNSFACFNGVYLGASQPGFIKLAGIDDNGVPIDADVKLGKIPLELNKVRDVWVQGRANGDMRAEHLGRRGARFISSRKIIC